MVNSKEFILKTARDNGIESFFLFRQDPDDVSSLVYSGDKPKSLEDKLAELEYHLNCDYGVVWLQMRSKAGLGPAFKRREDRGCIIFQDKVNLSEQPKTIETPKPLGGLSDGSFSSNPSLELIRQYESEKMNMQQTIGQLTTQMTQIDMENRHRFELDKKDRVIEQLQKELAEAKNGDTKIMSYLSHFTDILNPQPVSSRPMAGHGDTTTSSDTKKAIVDAVNVLMEIDPDFPDTISKIAVLVKNNKPMYDQAKKMLNSMA